MPEGPAERLLRWFRSGRRDLPWRTPFPRDPYAVLVSEVMLQQTRVDRVVEAYGRFLERFPSLEALAGASEEEVVHAFSGLGYYRRARLLHASARAVVARGSWPREAAQLARLPGFGRYTSAAVAAFAFGGSEPPVDGNVGRVTARVRAMASPTGSAALLAAGLQFAADLYAESPTPDVWEALMELGATVCTPAAPRCVRCPLSVACSSLAAGTPEAFPLPRRQRARERHRWVVLWLEREDRRVLLRRVDEGTVLAGMWLPPFAVVSDGTEPAECARTLVHDAGFVVSVSRGPVVRHVITHRDIQVLPYLGRVTGARVAEARPGWSWQDPDAPTVATSSLLGKLARACRMGRPQPAQEQEV